MRPQDRLIIRAVVAAATLVAATAAMSVDIANAGFEPDVEQLDILAPPGSEDFGLPSLVLSNGNYVVVDSKWDNGAVTDVGAVSLYDGITNTVINTLTGSTAFDLIGENGVFEVGDSNFVVVSSTWDGPGAVDAGAVTWASGVTGVPGSSTVDASNSLVGSTAGDAIGDENVEVLSNGHAVVLSPDWDSSAFVDAGAITWMSGDTGLTGPVDASNSMVGETGGVNLGGGGVTPLTNGNYVVSSPNRSTGALLNTGAATWVDGSGPATGSVTTANSLYGTQSGDRVGLSIRALSNGNYVVLSRDWNNGSMTDVGAVTWADGTTGVTGAVSTTNSLHGTSPMDRVGSQLTTLPNGNYVVASKDWDHGGVVDAGAVTWGDGDGGLVGPVTTANSLHGSTTSDLVGRSVYALANGNYVAATRTWDDGVLTDVGAATWGSGTAPSSGPVSLSNSLHGTQSSDQIGAFGVVALTNGNYLVLSANWQFNGNADAGAVTWADGSTGLTGPVTVTNSLHGEQFGDGVGRDGEALSNGNGVVVTETWSNGATADVGAVTWIDGTEGLVGPVSTANSLFGTTAGDMVGSGPQAFGGGVTPLDDGSFVVTSSVWNASGKVEAGAVTWAAGTGPVVGAVNESNSLIGSTAMDHVGSRGVTALEGGAYVVNSHEWASDQFANAGAATLGTAGRGVSGFITTTNSVIGTPPGEISSVRPRLTSGDAVVVQTRQDRVILMQLTREPAIVTTDPARFLDTRVDGETIDGLEQGAGPVGAMSEIEVVVAGRGEVPIDAAAVVMNVTAINPSGRGFVTLHPCGTRPLASSLNYSSAGVVVGNEVIAKLSPSGTVCAYTSASTHLTFDVGGHVTATSEYRSLDPVRLLETRVGESTVDGLEELGGAVGAMSEVEVQVAGRGGVPSGASAVVLNVTAINPSGRGFVTLHPCGTRPLASSLNYASAGVVVGNEVVAKLSAAGTVCAYTSASTHLTFDAAGFIPG